MAKKNFKSIIDELMEQFGESGYEGKFHQERVNFSNPFPVSSSSSGGVKISPILEALNKAAGAYFGKEKDSGSQEGSNDGKPGNKNLNKSHSQVKLPSSSTIQSAAYWPTREYLVVSFKSGHTYSYQGVELTTVALWQQASSAGSFFYYNIRMKYSYQKMG